MQVKALANVGNKKVFSTTLKNLSGNVHLLCYCCFRVFFLTVLNIHTFHDSFTQVLRKFVFKFLVTAAIKLSVDKM